MSTLLKYLLVALSLTLIPVVLFAEDGGTTDAETYEAYKKRVTETCETDKPWTNGDEWGGNIISIPPYPELEKSAIEKRRDDIINAKNTPEEQERLRKELDIARITNLKTFKTLEIVRIDYRTAMNKVFGCAVIQSREAMLENLIKEIEKKYPTPQSEIKQKLKREWERLKIQKQALSCINQSGEKDTPQSTRVINGAVRQYCHYDGYLRYLRDNLDKNNDYILSLDASIGQIVGAVTPIPTNTEAWSREIARRGELITAEILRAKSVLPRAIEAFREMERTYSLHLMLVIIYDDYLRLRENLATYFNAVTQLMEKMQNAQIPNNK